MRGLLHTYYFIPLLVYVLRCHMQATFVMHNTAPDPTCRLDYPGIGPEHSFLKDVGRAEYFSVTDQVRGPTSDILVCIISCMLVSWADSPDSW